MNEEFQYVNGRFDRVVRDALYSAFGVACVLTLAVLASDPPRH